MKISSNKFFFEDTNKFLNFYKGKNENKYFFLLPCISISSEKISNWTIKIRSIFLAWGYWFVQFNICETISDTSLEFTREYYEKLCRCLAASNITITNMQEAVDFIRNNIYIVQILKNSNVEHPYVKKILASFFYNQPFSTVQNTNAE